MEDYVQCIDKKVTEWMNSTLMAPFTSLEIYETLKKTSPFKSPRPNGFWSGILSRALEYCGAMYAWLYLIF